MSATRRGGGGGIVSGFFVIAIVAAFVMAWWNANNFRSAGEVFSWFRNLSDSIQECGGDVAQAFWGGCFENTTIIPPINIGGNNGDSSHGNGDSEEAGISTPKFIQEMPSEAPAVQDSKIPSPNTDNITYVLSLLSDIKTSNARNVDYDRSSFRHWVNPPEYNCNARVVTLKRQGSDVEIDSNNECRIISGNWVDPYTGESFTNPSDLDIDHIIPLSFANSHGANDWTADRKQEFANDVDLNLWAVSASSNRSKGDAGPAQWMPPNEDFHCTYADRWVRIASHYELTLSRADVNKLTEVLNGCK